MTSMTYQVTGMTCEHCVRAVTDEIASLAGVSAVTVALVPGGESAVTVTSDGPLATEVCRRGAGRGGRVQLVKPCLDAAGSVTGSSHVSTTDLVIGGMTCASCAVRVEKKLNKLDGVTAMVNLATETAHVSFPDSVSVADLVRGGGAHRLHRRAARGGARRRGRDQGGLRVAASPAGRFHWRSPFP